MTTVKKSRGYGLSYIKITIQIREEEEKQNIHLVNRIRIIKKKKRLDKMSVGRNIQTPDHSNIQLHTSDS